MAEATPKQNGPRVVVRVSPEMQFLLTQVAARTLQNKKDLHETIWRAGLQAHLGITPEEVDEAEVRSLPRGTAAKSAKQITQMMIANR
jgi:hypothetical protein